MKKIIAALVFTSAATLTLSACTNTQVGTVAGGAAGAGLGYALTGGSAGGAIIGAGAGALIGNQIGQSQDYYYGYRGYRGPYVYY
ncbi:MAG: glycine zipper domain-containing protein [Tatlockia sp.]